mmetsp:Transcript_14413/g.45432  ORF Transcript_14413/g.45432 Transcript_14413/m.45432 type:complete len:169 (+) Transcript_14413:3-509(+)
MFFLLFALPSVLGFHAARLATIGSTSPRRQGTPLAPIATSRTRDAIVTLVAPGGGPPSQVVKLDPGVKLLLCLVIDFIGMASFAAPGVGEAADLGWAPVSALLVNYLFGNGVFTSLALVEELLPGFDVIPTATIAWAIEYFSNSSGERPQEDTRDRPYLDDAIDVTTD